jgi:hypothetical protein
MDRLPTEVFISIISHLPQRSKLNCIRVCKKWNEVITTYNLYNTLIFKQERKLTQALSLFKRKDYIGYHVRHLHIVALNVDPESILSLATLLPRIKSLK